MYVFPFPSAYPPVGYFSQGPTNPLSVFQTVGGAFFVAAAQSAFINTMINSVAVNAPHINPGMLILTGATELRRAFSPEDLPSVLIGYMAGLKVAFAISIAGAGVAFVVSCFSRWQRLNPKDIQGGGAA